MLMTDIELRLFNTSFNTITKCETTITKEIKDNEDLRRNPYTASWVKLSCYNLLNVAVSLYSSNVKVVTFLYTNIEIILLCHAKIKRALGCNKLGSYNTVLLTPVVRYVVCRWIRGSLMFLVGLYAFAKTSGNQLADDRWKVVQSVLDAPEKYC